MFRALAGRCGAGIWSPPINISRWFHQCREGEWTGERHCTASSDNLGWPWTAVIRIIRLKLMLDEGQKVSLLRTMEAYTRAFDYST